MASSNLQPHDVTSLLGDLHASKVAAIINCGATLEDVQKAYDLVQSRPPSVPLGPVGDVYRILAADDELWSAGVDE